MSRRRIRGTHALAAVLLVAALCKLGGAAEARVLEFVGTVERSEAVPLGGAHGVAVSPEGSEVFVVSFDDNSLVVWQRNVRTGSLSFAQAFLDGTNGVSGLFRPVRVAVTPDGGSVYVGAFFGDSLAVFLRNSNGLTFAQALFGGATGLFGLTQVRGVVVSPDSRFVYVASYGDNAVRALRRNPRDGILEPADVLFDLDEGGTVPGLVRPSAIALSPDGSVLYVTSSGAGSLVVFTRDSNDGGLRHEATFFEGVDGVSGLLDAEAVAVSPEGQHVYVGSSNGLSQFDWQAGQLQFVSSLGGEVVGPPELGGASDLVLTPQGNYAFLSRAGDDTLVVLRRDAGSGALRPVESYQAEADSIRGLAGASSLAVSPDGQWLYVAAQFDDAVGIFRRLPDCWGDCNEDGQVSVDELVVAVRHALEEPAPLACWQADRSRDGRVTVEEIVVGVQGALMGCALPEQGS